MIDIKNFAEKETAGLMSVVRITDDSLAFSTRKFDPTTGEEIKPAEVIGGSLQEYRDEVVKLQARISELNAFITKVGRLETQN